MRYRFLMLIINDFYATLQKVSVPIMLVLSLCYIWKYFGNHLYVYTSKHFGIVVSWFFTFENILSKSHTNMIQKYLFGQIAYHCEINNQFIQNIAHCYGIN